MKMKKRSRYITLATIAFWTVVLIGWIYMTLVPDS